MTERADAKDRDQAGPAPAPNGRASGQDGPSADSDVLAFFYLDAGRAFAQLRADAEELGRRAERVGRFLGEAGLAASADARREFHRACDIADRVSGFTYRLLEILRADLE